MKARFRRQNHLKRNTVVSLGMEQTTPDPFKAGGIKNVSSEESALFGPTVNSLVIKDPTFYLSLAVVGFTVATVTVSGNAALLLTIFRDTRRLLQTPPSLLIANLCISDLMVGLITGNLVALKDVYRHQNLPVPDKLDPIIRLSLGLSLFVSSGTIIALSYDRYMVVMHPFKYKCTVTREKVKNFIVIIWIASFTICFVPVTKIPEKVLAIVFAHIHASIPAVVLTVMYVEVFRALGERKRELRDAGITSEMRSKQVLDRERKMVVTILIVLALFYVTFVPEFIALHLLHFYGPSARSLAFKKLEIVLSRFLFLNSAMNPFVYAWRLPKYRKAVFRFCSCKLFPAQKSDKKRFDHRFNV